MKLIMAVSEDGYMSRSKCDDMRWLGRTDKAVFRLLTLTDRDPLFVSARSRPYIPELLPGRYLYSLSTKAEHGPGTRMSLRQVARGWPRAWLLGGPTLARIALEQGHVDEVHLCRSDRKAFPDSMAMGAIADTVSPYLMAYPLEWLRTTTTRINDVTVECWKKVHG